MECWGNNNYGQLEVPDDTYTTVAVFGGQACAVTSAGAVRCWGNNDYGQRHWPGGTYNAVATGWGFTCAITSEGTIECWDRAPNPSPGIEWTTFAKEQAG